METTATYDQAQGVYYVEHLIHLHRNTGLPTEQYMPSCCRHGPADGEGKNEESMLFVRPRDNDMKQYQALQTLKTLDTKWD